jgi:hypothetical protein
MFCIHFLSHGDHQGLVLIHFCFCDLHYFHPLEPSFILEFFSNAFESFVFVFYHLVTIRY